MDGLEFERERGVDGWKEGRVGFGGFIVGVGSCG